MMKSDQSIETRLFIHGEFVPSISGKTFQVINPMNGKITADVFEANGEDVDIAVQSAKRAQPAWAALNGKHLMLIY